MAGQPLQHHRRHTGIDAEVGAGPLGVGLGKLADHFKAVTGLGRLGGGCGVGHGRQVNGEVVPEPVPNQAQGARKGAWRE